jgi:hypothetical protein
MRQADGIPGAGARQLISRSLISFSAQKEIAFCVNALPRQMDRIIPAASLYKILRLDATCYSVGKKHGTLIRIPLEMQ